MPGGLTLLESLNADIPTPATGKSTLFFSIDLGVPAYKDDAGVVHTLVGAAGTTGATGAPGPAGYGFDGEDGDAPVAMPGPQGNPGATGATGAASTAIGPPGTDGESGGGGDDVMFPPGKILSNNAGGEWKLAGSVTLSATTHDFPNLGTPNEIMMFLVAATFSSSDRVVARVSVDNGANYLAASGDYIAILGNGSTSNQTSLQFYDANATAARSGCINIMACNLVAPKPSRSNFFTNDAIGLRYISNTGQITAVRIISTGGNAMTGGTLYVFTR